MDYFISLCFPFYFLILDLGLGVSDITHDCHKLSHNMTLCHISVLYINHMSRS